MRRIAITALTLACTIVPAITPAATAAPNANKDAVRRQATAYAESKSALYRTFSADLEAEFERLGPGSYQGLMRTYLPDEDRVGVYLDTIHALHTTPLLESQNQLCRAYLSSIPREDLYVEAFAAYAPVLGHALHPETPTDLFEMALAVQGYTTAMFELALDTPHCQARRAEFEAEYQAFEN